jgi:hypothetical protein
MSTATELSMLIANLSKHPSFQRVLTLNIPARQSLEPSGATIAIDQLLSVFLLGESGRYNPTCNFDHLAYAFAELAKFPEARKYFTTPRGDDAEHHRLLKPDLGENNILPFILLPLMGSEEYPDDEMEFMPEELQLLPPDKQRENDTEILKTHLDSLLLLSTTKEGRDIMRADQVYPIVRECHLAVEDESVRESCDRFVQVLMREEESDGIKPAEVDAEDDEDYKIVDV